MDDWKVQIGNAVMRDYFYCGSMRSILIILFVKGLFIHVSSVLALDVTLHINADTTTRFGEPVAACSYNWSEVFEMKNAIIRVQFGEVLNATVINHDSLPHTFTVDGAFSPGVDLPAGDTAFAAVSFSTEGTYRYHSTSLRGSLLGASGQILVGFFPNAAFYWNLFEVDPALSLQMAAGSVTTYPPDHQPDQFYINGTHHPYTLDDADAFVDVTLGASVIISIVNSGRLEHVLHFHGFHVEILGSSQHPGRVGWIKDTFPVKRGETVTVRLVVDQIGTYPVHDHNLIAVTNAGYYPGGMLTHIHVTP